MSIATRNLLSVVQSLACLGLLSIASGCCCGSGWMMNHCGMRHYRCGNYAMAMKDFQRAVIDDPKVPDYRHNLAMAKQKTGDFAGAEEVLRHNLTVDPMHQPSYHALAQLLVNQQRQGEAEQLLAGWRDTQPYVPETYVEMAWLQRQEGNRMAAEQSLRQALQVKRNHPQALAQLGQLYQESGQNEQAASLYQQSLLTEWNQPQVHSQLASLNGSTIPSPRLRRSAMLKNNMYSDTAVADASPMTYQTASFTPMGTTVAMDSQSPDFAMIEDGPPQRGLRRRPRLGKLPAYPLPDYRNSDFAPMQTDALASSQVISNTAAFVPADGSIIASQPGYPPTPIATTSQPLLPPSSPIMTAKMPNLQADPAHAHEDGVAGVPVVEPY